MKFKLFATCIFGVEKIIKNELISIGADEITLDNGRVYFEGSSDIIAKSNICLRCAERIYIKTASFTAKTFEELFQGIRAVDWVSYLPENACFPVEASSINSTLFSTSDIQAISKKAIVEKLKQKYKKEWFDETGSKYRIEVSIYKDNVTVGIDTSGTGLHKRGYRKYVGVAPLKETIAAAIIMTSRWRRDRALIDPMCGSGTIPIEAALIGRNIAPGLYRDFAACSFSNLIPKKVWEDAYNEAKESINNEDGLLISGSDIDENALKLARQHAVLAKVAKDIHFQKMDFKDIRSSKKYGFFITNPPYGERIGDKKDVEKLYEQIGMKFSDFDTWSKYILSPNKYFEKLYGKNADKRRKLYNGMIPCTLYQYYGEKPPAYFNKNKV